MLQLSHDSARLSYASNRKIGRIVHRVDSFGLTYRRLLWSSQFTAWLMKDGRLELCFGAAPKRSKTS